MAVYDAIVLGLGGMGSAAAYHLARRGQRVLGLEAFGPGHANGSSHGASRIIREVYAEGDRYMPLVRRAYRLWAELEGEAAEPLLTITGGLTIGPADGSDVTAVQAVARAHGLRCDRLSPAEAQRRFPGVRLDESMVALYQPNSGVLRADRCVAAHGVLARRCGARLRYQEPALRWQPDGSGVRVDTALGTYRAARLVITAGPWAPALLARLGLPLTVTRMYNVYFAPTRAEHYVKGHFPIFGLDTPLGEYYGFPVLPGDGFKFGRHDGGEACTPATARRTVTDEEIAAYRAVLERYLPGAVGRVLKTTTCLYTRSADHHFIVGRDPESAPIVFATGCSGHAFKFTGVLGELLADLATDTAPRVPAAFLAPSAERFGQAWGTLAAVPA